MKQVKEGKGRGGKGRGRGGTVVGMMRGEGGRGVRK